MASNTRPDRRLDEREGEALRGRRWRTAMFVAAGAAALSLVLLVMTGIPAFTWLTGLASAAAIVCFIADMMHPG